MVTASKKSKRYPGVEARPNSIRVTFTADGVSYKKTVNASDGTPLEPSDFNMKVAANLVADIKRSIAAGTFSMSNFFADETATGVDEASSETKRMPTLSEQLDLWLETIKTLAASTQDGYVSAAKFWKKAPAELHPDGTTCRAIGDIPVDELKLSHLKIAINSKANRSGKTTNNYLSAFKGAMELALGDGLITAYPDTALGRRKHQKKQPDPFSLGEVQIILNDMRERYDERVSNLVEFWALTGLRTSELYGLRWGSVDFRKGEILVHEVLVRGEYKDSTKTSSARVVELSKRAVELLKAQRKFTLMQGVEALIFDNPTDGKAWDDERDFRRSYWTPTLRRVGIRYRRPYQLRHTNASMRLMSGQIVGYAATQLGHSIDMFAQIYARWIHGLHNAIERDKFDAFTAANAEIMGAVATARRTV